MLSETDRRKIYVGFMRYLSNLREPLALTKPHLLLAVNATDDWIDGNAASYNSALPVQARTNMTASQKTLLFCAVALMRVSVNFLRSVFGGVDG